MKCNTCGFESEEQFSRCPQCGAEAQTAKVSENTAATTVLAMLKDKLFLALCIVVSFSCIMSISAGNLPLLHILITVFLWLTYAGAQKGVADADQLRNVSGTVYAQYVINHVLAVLLLVMGALFMVFFGAVASNVTIQKVLTEALSGVGVPTDLMGLLSLSGPVVFIAFAVAAAMIILFNFLIYGNIHTFLKSLYISVQAGKLELQNVRKARTWLLILGICSGLGVLDASAAPTAAAAALSSAASCATCILTWLLIGKYLMEEN